MREMIQEMRTTMGADLASPLDIDTGKPATDSVWAFGKSAMASALKSEGAAVSQGERIATGEAMEVD